MMSFSTSSQKPYATLPATRMERIAAYRWFIALSVAIFILDQLSKLWINRLLPLGTYGPPDHIQVISDIFNLVHVGNTGAAWSLFSGKSTLLALLAISTLCAIFYWRQSLGLRIVPIQISFGLICGGIVGNLFDRLVHGHVIDFLDFHFGSYTYPTFNVADSGICVGVIIYLFYSLRNPGF